jgi:hypothetical protein
MLRRRLGTPRPPQRSMNQDAFVVEDYGGNELSG